MPRLFSQSRIGIDLDNTLISYDRLFVETALGRGLVPAAFSGAKRELRDRVRLLPEGEVEWQRLQAHVYGPAISGAHASDGALDFIKLARANGAQLSIVSHKSVVSNLGSETVNLRDAARGWLERSGMVGPDAVPEDRVFFEDSRADKIGRIIGLGCTHFIDDLEEVFDDPSFPPHVERLFFAPGATSAHQKYPTFTSFYEIARAFATR